MRMRVGQVGGGGKGSVAVTAPRPTPRPSRRPSPRRPLHTTGCLLLAAALLGALGGCEATEDERYAEFTSTPQGRAAYEAFQRDRDACQEIAERITPYSDRYVAFSGTFRDDWIESQMQHCMIARGWNDGRADGWDRGRRQ